MAISLGGFSRARGCSGYSHRLEGVLPLVSGPVETNVVPYHIFAARKTVLLEFMLKPADLIDQVGRRPAYRPT
jgi:hypothetical protein